jgi:hypothetical protein
MAEFRARTTPWLAALEAGARPGMLAR